MHFSCLVVSADVNEALEPFADYHKVEPYRHFVETDELELMAKHFGLTPQAEVLVSKLREWRQEEGGLHDGRLFTWSTENPNAKFDWYEAGGRFGPFLQLREPRIESRWWGLRRQRVTHVTRARKAEVAAEPLLAAPPAALLHRGRWCEAPMSLQEAPNPGWLREFATAYAEIDEGAVLNAMDLHS